MPRSANEGANGVQLNGRCVLVDAMWDSGESGATQFGELRGR
jgi:hypothetical protein